MLLYPAGSDIVTIENVTDQQNIPQIAIAEYSTTDFRAYYDPGFAMPLLPALAGDKAFPPAKGPRHKTNSSSVLAVFHMCRVRWREQCSELRSLAVSKLLRHSAAPGR
jgi:hypothetical protein